MPDTNASYRPETRSERIKVQIQKLEAMDHETAPVPTFDAFDSETEDLLVEFYGESHQYVEAYKYASLGEAEAMVNLPEEAQETLAVDLPKKSLQQRRQLLEGVLSELEEIEDAEEEALTGEDHEDPPGIS
jgi:hypothetical protein